MSDLLRLLHEIEDYRAFCQAWGIPLSFSRKDREDLEELEQLAKAYLEQHATSQPQPVVEITEEDIPW